MEDHYAYLQELHRTGTLVLAGPCLDGAYGIVILEAATEVDAALISENDPSVVSGVMDVELHPYRISLWRQP